MTYLRPNEKDQKAIIH